MVAVGGLSLAACELAFPTHAETSGDAGAHGATDGSADAGGQVTDSGGEAAPDAAGPPALVQQVSAFGSGSTFTIVLHSPPSPGNALVFAVCQDSNPPDTVTSGGGSPWIKRAASGNHVPIAVWTLFGAASSDQSATATWNSNPSHFSGNLSEWSNVRSFVAQAGNDGVGGVSTSIDTPPLAASPGQLVFAAAGVDVSDTFMGPFQGFTALSYPEGDAGGVALSAYVVAPEAGTYSTFWTLSPMDGWDAVMVTLSP